MLGEITTSIENGAGDDRPDLDDKVYNKMLHHYATRELNSLYVGLSLSPPKVWGLRLLMPGIVKLCVQNGLYRCLDLVLYTQRVVSGALLEELLTIFEKHEQTIPLGRNSDQWVPVMTALIVESRVIQNLNRDAGKFNTLAGERDLAAVLRMYMEAITSLTGQLGKPGKMPEGLETRAMCLLFLGYHLGFATRTVVYEKTKSTPQDHSQRLYKLLGGNLLLANLLKGYVNAGHGATESLAIFLDKDPDFLASDIQRRVSTLGTTSNGIESKEKTPLSLGPFSSDLYPKSPLTPIFTNILSPLFWVLASLTELTEKFYGTTKASIPFDNLVTILNTLQFIIKTPDGFKEIDTVYTFTPAFILHLVHVLRLPLQYEEIRPQFIFPPTMNNLLCVIRNTLKSKAGADLTEGMQSLFGRIRGTFTFCLGDKDNLDNPPQGPEEYHVGFAGDVTVTSLDTSGLVLQELLSIPKPLVNRICGFKDCQHKKVQSQELDLVAPNYLVIAPDSHDIYQKKYTFAGRAIQDPAHAGRYRPFISFGSPARMPVAVRYRTGAFISMVEDSTGRLSSVRATVITGNSLTEEMAGKSGSATIAAGGDIVKTGDSGDIVGDVEYFNNILLRVYVADYTEEEVLMSRANDRLRLELLNDLGDISTADWRLDYRSLAKSYEHAEAVPVKPAEPAAAAATGGDGGDGGDPLAAHDGGGAKFWTPPWRKKSVARTRGNGDEKPSLAKMLASKGYHHHHHEKSEQVGGGTGVSGRDENNNKDTHLDEISSSDDDVSSSDSSSDDDSDSSTTTTSSSSDSEEEEEGLGGGEETGGKENAEPPPISATASQDMVSGYISSDSSDTSDNEADTSDLDTSDVSSISTDSSSDDDDDD